MEITLSRARSVAARLRLIDFFDASGLSLAAAAARSRPALPFSDETHDRDRENRDAHGGTLERLGRKKKQNEEEDEEDKKKKRQTKKLRFPRTESRSTRCCVTYESIEASAPMARIITIRDQAQEVRRKEKRRKGERNKSSRNGDARNCLPPKLDRFVYSRGLRNAFYRRLSVRAKRRRRTGRERTNECTVVRCVRD